ncbi:MAG TPA: hypothetical protein VGF13_18935 [Verrucomicrobiae bacterium]|jgi:hypothetical protein
MLGVAKLNRFLTALAVVMTFARMTTPASAATQQAYVKASNTGADDQFGYSVAISGNTMIVGASREDSNATGVNGDQTNNAARDAGATYIFVRDGTNWSQQAYVKPSEPTGYFGRWVAISGDTALICGPAIWVFVRDGTNWSQQAILEGGVGIKNFAAISGDTVVALTYPMGAYVYSRTGTNWTQQAFLIAPAAWTVAVDGDVAVVGSYDGHASIFTRTGTNWSRQAYLTDVSYDYESVAVSGETVVLSGQDSAYIYARNGTNWAREATLQPPYFEDGPNYENFGTSVSVSGNVVAVGAGADNGEEDSIATLVFVRCGTNWTLRVQLMETYATNPYYDGGSGSCVAVSGETVVVGKPFEHFNATGVNAEITGVASESGAAFVYTGPFNYVSEEVSPRLFLIPDHSGGYYLDFHGAPNMTYQVQRAPSVTGPWTTNATFTTVCPGPIEFHDTNAPSGQAFYRVAQQ